MILAPAIGLLGADVEAAQALSQVPRDIGGRRLPPTPIRGGKAIQQRRSCAGESDFQMEREGVVVDSGHEPMRTNMER